MAYNREFKGVWIPREIYLDENLSWTEKILLVEVDSLEGSKGCFASNEYFGNFLGISKDRVSRIVSKLAMEGYLTVQMTYKPNSKQVDKRWLKITRGYRRKQQEGIGENNDTPIGENNEDNNTSFNNTFNNTVNKRKDNVELPSTVVSNDFVIDEIIRYLNLKVGKNYKPTTKEYRRYINARLKEGRTLEEFKYVIDTKVAEWLGNSKMEKHLTPVTLFREGNFDKYLNQEFKQKEKTLRDLAFAGQIDLSDIL